MSEKKRKNFSSQFKAKVALEAIRGVKTVTEIAQAFGVHPTQVGQWKKVLQDQARRDIRHYARSRAGRSCCQFGAALLRDRAAENGAGLA